MSLVRKQIRSEVTAFLKGSTGAGDKVFPSRITPNKKENLPVINVYTPTEDVSDSGEAPLLNNRDLTVVCEIIASGSENDNDPADQCDEIAEQIEQLFFAEDRNAKGKLGCLVDKIRLTSVACEYESNGESAIVSCRLGFVFNYKKEAVESDPDNINELDRINAKWDVGTASDPDPEAEDNIELGP